ncbi:UDP-glucose 4-epimerase GalE [Halomonas sp. MCCC 1A17488]|uniref:UDP-glucose 4-epimerase GalE n=1 Tax=unclassified Halomonas TaxID=2609666 RepID=UPI0018D24712|nr:MULTISPECIES: UDP-glucose 4-epimerase GalE [unclassified Halomonas]MCE8014839.1 UDP-glucose 4-epimerase GalE [Halomonas sp. MCCC 1A17488]MCG3238172.1 UDP-glucose 4-epimerase GalE [Halomonas sp. MCCC 1A17488]QPP48061.1 UDP-glucose 4-epimerase GalE [Halomonas sp. SS10-MC5]
MTIFVTGGAGYIGSHTVVELLEAGYEVVVLDNLVNGSREALQRVEAITGKAVRFVEGDVRDRALLDRLFAEHAIEAVIHFAGLKAVGESVEQPLAYYDANVHGSLVLCQAMAAAGVYRLVFSSSATVYGPAAPVPYVECLTRGRTANPYGSSKAMVEQLLEDQCRADPRWSVALLRYFNPIGAHPSGLIGEDPRGTPNNLMPFIAQVAVGRLPALAIFGNDYPTVDGTGVRDYLHVVDLAAGHVQSLASLERPGAHIYNLGTGQGVSVLQMVETFERVTGQQVPYRFVPRRDGDLAEVYADVAKAERELGWRAERGLEAMLCDTWRWQEQNPRGYEGSGVKKAKGEKAETR